MIFTLGMLGMLGMLGGMGGVPLGGDANIS